MAKSKKKMKLKKERIVVTILILVAVLGFFLYKTRPKLQVVTVVSTIDNYNYQLESNATRLYKKYYKELEKEIKNSKIDEEKYASLVAELFVIDYYTLANKITNKDIGGVQFIHTDLKNQFINESSSTIYKYVKSNLYGKRKQKLPEINDIKVKNTNKIKYDNKGYKDNSAYEITVNVGYVKKMDYPQEVKVTLIHEEMKLSIIEIK